MPSPLDRGDERFDVTVNRWRREAASARALLDEAERSLATPAVHDAIRAQLGEALCRLGSDLARHAAK